MLSRNMSFLPLAKEGEDMGNKNLLIREVAVIEVSEGKNNTGHSANRPDCFTASIKTIGIEFISDKDPAKELIDYADKVKNFSERWIFMRQGDWWPLHEMK